MPDQDHKKEDEPAEEEGLEGKNRQNRKSRHKEPRNWQRKEC